MRRHSGSDHMAFSFVDLMTSLMVIFILLLVVFLNNRASAGRAGMTSLANDVRAQLTAAGLDSSSLPRDPADPFAILIGLPRPLGFARSKSKLAKDDEQFLRQRLPAIAKVICAERFRPYVETVLIEGSSDNSGYKGLTPSESQARNLQLGQDRAREVATKSLSFLNTVDQRDCFEAKLFAGARTERSSALSPELARSVLFRVRLRSPEAALALKESMRSKAKEEARRRPPPASAIKLVSLFERLRANPKQAVTFELTESELNEYLDYSLGGTPRPGIEAISMKVFGHNYLSLLTVIDFDSLERARPGTVPSMFRTLLRGKKSLWLDVRFSAREGKGAYTVEKAYFEGQPLPPFLVRQVLGAIGSLQPEGFRIEDGMNLPLGLRTVRTQRRVVLGAN